MLPAPKRAQGRRLTWLALPHNVPAGVGPEADMLPASQRA